MQISIKLEFSQNEVEIFAWQAPVLNFWFYFNLLCSKSSESIFKTESHYFYDNV